MGAEVEIRVLVRRVDLPLAAKALEEASKGAPEVEALEAEDAP
jgi:hypothetical protein